MLAPIDAAAASDDVVVTLAADDVAVADEKHHSRADCHFTFCYESLLRCR